VPNIICRDLSFGYDGSQIQVFNSLNLLIDTGWRTALVGRNGRGKTTLMRLLAGELRPDTGEIERPVSCRLFTGAAQDPQELAWEAARAAAGPFRRWEQELETLAAAADERSLERYGELETVRGSNGSWMHWPSSRTVADADLTSSPAVSRPAACWRACLRWTTAFP
jgi:lincosamide and streptogramin A transport system ATP-binding/permease protein